MTKPLRVLIVEDSEDDALLIVRELERGGYAPAFERVETGEAVSAALDRQAWDMVIADYALPHFSGLGALKLVNERGLDLPFIIVSGAVGEDAAVEAMKAGAHDYFMKNNVARLPAAVEQELHEAQVRKERKKANEALRQGKERYRYLFENLHDAAFLADAETGIILQTNRQGEALLGKERDEIVRMHQCELHPPKKAEEYRNKFAEHVQKGHAADFQGEVVKGDGTIVPVSINATTFTIGGRRLILGLFRDITERKLLEAQLRHSQKMEAIGRLAGGVAHDFNNLLAGMIGFTQLALDRLPRDDPIAKDLKEVRHLAGRAANLTRQLLAFGRREPTKPLVFNINELVKNTADMLEQVIGEDIELEFVPAAHLGNVEADPGQIEQVLMNLAVNSRDAMPDGGKLTIETCNVALDQDYSHRHVGVRPGPYVMLAVTDTGLGMDRETQAHIFEPFFTTKDQNTGTGLGLATVYAIVKRHGGNIWVYSEKGKGTTFKVYLPEVGGKAARLAEKNEPEATAGGTETILVVEDEDAVRRVAKRVLEKRGYDVLTAASATEAEQVFDERGESISLLLTDLVLPERNGHELYESLSSKCPSLVVLYVSGYTDNAIVHNGVLEPDAPFLQKPFTPDALARKVREMLDADPTR